MEGRQSNKRQDEAMEEEEDTQEEDIKMCVSKTENYLQDAGQSLFDVDLRRHAAMDEVAVQNDLQYFHYKKSKVHTYTHT